MGYCYFHFMAHLIASLSLLVLFLEVSLVVQVTAKEDKVTVTDSTSISSLSYDSDSSDSSYAFDDVITTSMYYQIVSRHAYDMKDNVKNKDMSPSELAEISLDVYTKRFFHTSLLINTSYVFYYGYGRDVSNNIGHEENVLKRLKDIRNESYDTTWIYQDFMTFRLGGIVKDERAVFFQKIELIHSTFLKFPNYTWYAWIDSGINSYRHYLPPRERWPQVNLTDRFPPKFVFHNFKHSHNPNFPYSAAAFFMHRSVIQEFRDAFYAIVLGGTVSCYKTGKCFTEQEVFRLVCDERPHLCHNGGDTLGKENFALNWGALLTENYKTRHCVNGPEIDDCIQYLGIKMEKDSTGSFWYGSKYHWPCSDKRKVGEVL